MIDLCSRSIIFLDGASFLVGGLLFVCWWSLVFCVVVSFFCFCFCCLCWFFVDGFFVCFVADYVFFFEGV